MEVSNINSLVELFFKKLKEVDNSKSFLNSLKSEKSIYSSLHLNGTTHTENKTTENFDETISSAPTDIVSIEEIDENMDTNDKATTITEEPIELKSEKITDFKLYLRVIGFENYESIRSVLDNYDNNLKYTSEKNNSKYDVIIGPLEKTEANNLVSYFISKGYKETEILIE